MTPDNYINLFLGVLFICVIAFFAGGIAGKREERNEAVRRGFAEYYLDKKHKKQFRWKDKQ